MQVKHLHGYTFEVSSRSNKHVTHLVQLDSKDPRDICDCAYTYCQTARKLKLGEPLDRSSYCAHVKAVALSIFDENILKEARKGL